jgi:L-alanine-DL-glutamate epimerase-like enolase superfamily enzyme
VDGAVLAPTAPGWGITLDPEFERAADVTTSAA